MQYPQPFHSSVRRGSQLQGVASLGVHLTGIILVSDLPIHNVAHGRRGRCPLFLNSLLMTQITPDTNRPFRKALLLRFPGKVKLLARRPVSIGVKLKPGL